MWNWLGVTYMFSCRHIYPHSVWGHGPTLPGHQAARSIYPDESGHSEIHQGSVTGKTAASV